MKQTLIRPTTGSFVAIWKHNGSLWSSTYRYNYSGALEEYATDVVDPENPDNIIGDHWKRSSIPVGVVTDIVYFTLD